MPLWEPSDTLEMIIIGDVMMHSRQLQHDHRTFLKEISPALKAADFAVANLEFPLAGPPYSGYPNFSTPDWYPEYLSECGINVFLLANNHILDKGGAGFSRSLKVYDRMAAEGSAEYTGAAASLERFEEVNPLIVSHRGISVALVNFTYGTNGGSSSRWPAVARMKKEEIGAQIQRAKEREADFIVALPHWGVEYELEHSLEQEELAKWLVSQGVDAIVGAHPHVVQDTMYIKDVPVIYSVGNAVSNMSVKNTRLELAVTIRFVRRGKGTPVMTEPELRWMWCTLPGKLIDSYSTIFADEWTGRRDEWLDPSDYDNMIRHLNERHCQTGSH